MSRSPPLTTKAVVAHNVAELGDATGFGFFFSRLVTAILLGATLAISIGSTIPREIPLHPPAKSPGGMATKG